MARQREIRLPSSGEEAKETALQVPAGFEVGETTVVLRAIEKNLRDPRVLQKQFSVRPNLLVKRTFGKNPPLTELAAELSQYLVRTIPSLTKVDSAKFVFADGVEGYRSICEFEPMPKIKLQQIHVLRVDPEGAMHFTLTVGVDTPSAVLDQYMSCIAATRFTG